MASTQDILEHVEPTDPVQVLRCAADELEHYAGHDSYRIDMGTWHYPRDDGRCHICLAGALMAGILDNSGDDYADTADTEVLSVSDIKILLPGQNVSEGWDRAFDALDDFRAGKIEEFLLKFELMQSGPMKEEHALYGLLKEELGLDLWPRYGFEGELSADEVAELAEYCRIAADVIETWSRECQRKQ